MSLIENFLAGYTGNTATAYRRDLACWQGWLAEQEIDLLAATRANVDNYARHLEALGRSPSTVARRLSSVSGAYTYAVADGILERNPVTHVRRPKVSSESQTLGLSGKEARSFLAAAQRQGGRTEALATLLLTTACRLGEALALDITDLGVDHGHRVVRFDGKGGKVRVLPLAGAAEALDRLIAGRTSGPVFVTRTGKRLAQSTAFRTVQLVAMHAGIADAARVTPHSLRHTAITAALNAGSASRDVQDFAGHADPRMTARYDRSRFNLDRSPAHLLGTYFSEAS